MSRAVRKLLVSDCRCDSDGRTYEELFAKLDVNKDGKVDVSELKAGLAAMGIRTGTGAAQVENTHSQLEEHSPGRLEKLTVTETLGSVCLSVIP